MKKLIVAIGLSVLLLGGLVTVVVAQQSGAWIHIRVHELDEGGKNVSLNLPLAFAEAATGMVPEKAMAKGLGKLQAKGVSLTDIRQAWTQLKASGDAEFVSVEEEGKRTTVAREGNYIRVRVVDLRQAMPIELVSICPSLPSTPCSPDRERKSISEPQWPS